MPKSFSPLRYPGGKVKLYNYVVKILENNNLIGCTYVEPFAGGSGLALKLLFKNKVKRIILNDFDPAIYSFWYCVLYKTEELCNLIRNVDVTLEEWDKQKKIYLSAPTDKLLYGFSTFFLNRTNRSGVITGGMIGGRKQSGQYKLDARFNKEDLISKIEHIASLKDKILLYNLDAKELLKRSDITRLHKVFINLDPPYVAKGSQLYKNAFTPEDHEELSKTIFKCKKKWIVTYDICPLISKLYSGYKCEIIDITYSLKTTKAKEYVFYSNNLNTFK